MNDRTPAPNGSMTDSPIIGKAMEALVDRVRGYAEGDLPVLLSGPTGSGKELISREYAVQWCKRNQVSIEKDFAILNCTGMGDDLLRSELFGHVKGAFTGASKDHDGYVNSYRLICLDELGETGSNFQAQLLRVVESGEYQRVGSNAVERCETRFIAATNRLDGVRSDLRYRFHLFSVPRLARHPEDIPALIEHFARARPFKSVTRRFVRWAAAYTWPGNVRELLRICEEASVTGILDVPAESEIRVRAQNGPGGPDDSASPGMLSIDEFAASFGDILDVAAIENALVHEELESLDRRSVAALLQKIASSIEPVGSYFRKRRMRSMMSEVGLMPRRAGSPVVSPEKAALTQRLRDAGSVTELARREGIPTRTMRSRLEQAGVDPATALKGFRRRKRRPTQEQAPRLTGDKLQ